MKAAKNTPFLLIEFPVVTAITAALTGLLFPVIGGFMAPGRTIQCGNTRCQLTGHAAGATSLEVDLKAAQPNKMPL